MHNGYSLPMQKSYGWCDDCETLVGVEKFPTLTTLSNELELLHNKADELSNAHFLKRITRSLIPAIKRNYKIDLEYTNNAINSLQILIDFFSGSHRRPCCLMCGSQNISKIDDSVVSSCTQQVGLSSLNFIHPNCGGELHTHIKQEDYLIHVMLPLCRYSLTDGKLILIDHDA